MAKDDAPDDPLRLYERALAARGAKGERLARRAEEAAVRALDRDLLGSAPREPVLGRVSRARPSPPRTARTDSDAPGARRIG